MLVRDFAGCPSTGVCWMFFSWFGKEMVTASRIMTFLYILLPSPEIERAWRHRTGSFLSSKGEGGRKGQVLRDGSRGQESTLCWRGSNNKAGLRRRPDTLEHLVEHLVGAPGEEPCSASRLRPHFRESEDFVW